MAIKKIDVISLSGSPIATLNPKPQTTQSQKPGCVDEGAGAGTCVAAGASALRAGGDVRQGSAEQPGNLATHDVGAGRELFRGNFP